jgi:hypothetical protein
MSELFKLSDNQIRKVEELISDNRVRHLEVPSKDEISKAWKEGKTPMAKVLQGDGQVIGEITLKQAWLCKFFWL